MPDDKPADHVIDTEQHVRMLLNDAYLSRINNLKHSVKLAQKALQISRVINSKELIGLSLNKLSLFYMIMGEHKAAVSMAEEAIIYFTELNDENGIAEAKYSIAGVYYKTNNYHLGLIYLINCLTIYRKFNDYHNQARVQKSLGTIYEYFGDQKSAIQSYEAAIEAAQKAQDTNLESNAYNPLSGIYLKQNKVAEALEMINRSIIMKEQTGDTRGMAFALYGRGKVYIRTGQFKQAEADLKKTLSIQIDVGDQLGIGMAYNRIGALYIEMGLLEKAKKALMKGLRFSQKKNIVIIKFKCNYLLYLIYKRENNPVKALEYLEIYLNQKEEVINTQTLKIIENYELINKMELLEKEAEMQKEKAEIMEKKDRAEQSARVKQDFLSTMSHEIRTPLNAVITITSMLKDKSDEEEQQLLEALKFASNNLMLIINDILDFTKLDTGKVTIENRPGNFIDLLHNIKQTYANLALKKHLQLDLIVDKQLSLAYEFDETKIGQIMGNLVGNAIKYTDEGYVIINVERLLNEEGRDLIRFKITDTGIGIPESYFDEMFDSFSQPKSITTRKQGGSGLGLAIVKKLVELYGSHIHFESAVGKGSVFYFDLMLKKCAAPAKINISRSVQLKNRSVLLAEDNMINAMVASKLLSNWGITTMHAKNGAEVIEMAKLKTFDFILMDIHMPEINGFDATAHIRTNTNPNSNTPIFALTADITAELEKDYTNYFNGFLRKPIEVEKLYTALATVVLNANTANTPAQNN